MEKPAKNYRKKAPKYNLVIKNQIKLEVDDLKRFQINNSNF
jgi:hypothetical protein